MKKPLEMIEGKTALENFTKAMQAAFRVPKAAVQREEKRRRAARKKADNQR